jgi:hypothetical protein
MLKIPRIKEQFVTYMMPSTTIMELWETFIGRTMKQPNIQRRMLLRAIPPKIELEGWGDNAIQDTTANLQ